MRNKFYETLYQWITQKRSISNRDISSVCPETKVEKLEIEEIDLSFLMKYAKESNELLPFRKMMNKKLRNKIWQLLLSSKIKLEKDFSIDALAKYELTGGEIKSVIENGIRNMFKRYLETGNNELKMDDIISNIENEINYNKEKKVGFGV